MGRRTLTRTAIISFLFLAYPATAETKKIVAGPQFDKGGSWRFWFGEGYRRAWTTPVDLPVLDLQTEAGGLTPVRQVGGLQSLGLALAGADGRAYTFRKIEKDPVRVLPAGWRESGPAAVVRDQTSAAHPAASTIVGSLARSVGILFFRSRLTVMPDDDRLGKFRQEFGGAVGSLDEYPTPGYEGITEIVSSHDLWQKWLEGGPGNRVDSRSFLKARLFDLVVGNWDRHQGQWRWAHLPGRPLWVPVPEDPDQAFTRYQGTMVGVARKIQPRLQVYSGEYPKAIEGLTENNADITRWLLSDVEWPVYQEVAGELQAQMTDAVIEEALRQMPPAWYEIDGSQLAAWMKQRRDGLPAVARRFYRHLADRVDVRGSNRDDLATVRHEPDGSVDVSLAPASTAATEPPYFHRHFSAKETEEIRIYLLGGNDRLVTLGRPKDEVTLYVLGGAGDDRLDDSQGGGAQLWDSEGTNSLLRGSGTVVRTAAWTNPVAQSDRPWVEPRAYGHWTAPMVQLWWEPDQGLMIGGGFSRTGWAFRKYPWASQQAFTLLYSTGYQSIRSSYAGQFRISDSKVVGRLDLKASGAEDLNYYGLGNETPYADKSVAKTQQFVFSAFPSLRLEASNALAFYVGAEVKHIRPPDEGDKLVDQEQPYGAGAFGEVLLRGGLDWDSRGRSLGITAQRALLSPGASAAEEKVSGVRLAVDGFYAPRTWDAQVPFSGVDGSLSGFLGNQRILLALRCGGRAMWGRYPWFEAASIGGSDNVRGWDSSRFRGDSSLYTNAELRYWLGRRKAPLLPLRWGVFSYAESGRVWLEGESSDSWHSGAGVGLMAQLIGVPLALSGSMAWGDKDKGISFYVRGGYSF